MLLTRIVTGLVLAAGLAGAASAGEPVNATCPITGKAVDASSKMVMVGDQAIGVCCAKCQRTVEGWSDAKKTEYVATTLGTQAGATQKKKVEEKQKQADDKARGLGTDKMRPDPWTLGVCIVSGEKLDGPGEVLVHEGREVRFCCKNCLKKFQADPAKYLDSAKALIIKNQMPFYPMTTCVVGGGELGSMGEPVDYVYRNRLVRFCCAGCIPKFEAEPERYLKMLDQKAMEAQRAAYPLKTCVVGGGELGSMGEPVEMVVGGRLVRLCCKGCEPKIRKDPAAYLATLDEAWKKADPGRFKGS